MKPNLIVGDSLREVARLDTPVDIIVTDPPYPVGGKSSMTTKKTIIECDRMVRDLTQSLLMGVVRNTNWRDPNNCVVYLMCTWRIVSALYNGLMQENFMVQNCIVWDKISLGAQWGGYGARHELCLYARRGKLARKAPPLGVFGPDIIRVARGSSKHKTHAFAKPPELGYELTRMFKPCVVLDPFCGSGGLLVGAANAGHSVVGIDTNDEFIERAKKSFDNRQTGL